MDRNECNRSGGVKSKLFLEGTAAAVRPEVGGRSHLLPARRPRTLVVTDIPIFTSEALLRGTFSRYGNINLDSTWSVLCGGHCLRICPASFSPDQHAERRAYVALLAGLPRGTIAVDLAEIAEEISAKSINVPFSLNSYNPKPYAYCHFSSETAMENAKSISCALKKVGLTWHAPTEVTSLCHRCGHPNCNPDRCGSSSRPNRSARSWQSNDKLRELYNKHLPPSHPAKRHNRFARPDNNNNNGSRKNASHQRSRSCPNNQQQQSRSRSQRRRPWNRDNLQNNTQRPPVPDINEINYYTDRMDVTYPGPVALTDWKSIGASLEKVIGELAFLPRSLLP
ncbi:unnamed protein product [Rhizophagus irregularis]|nr:unnamed protein product [Rhizophagus irregularis]